MRSKIVKTSNILRFQDALGELQARGPGEEGMGLLWGRPGEGKSTTIAYITNTQGALFLTARVTWTVTTMLQALMRELDLKIQHRRDPMVDDAIESLTLHPRPVFVDEADYLFRQTDMLDALRDIYDAARVPVVLIGMDTIATTIRSKGGVNDKFARFRRRITQWVEFSGLTVGDARKVADEIVEVRVADDLVEYVHQETAGNIGNMIIAYGQIERFARTNGLDAVAVEEFGRRPLPGRRAA